MATKISILVSSGGSIVADPDKWQFHVTRVTTKAAVITALMAFVKQYDTELQEASRDLFNVLEALKPVLQKPKEGTEE